MELNLTRQPLFINETLLDTTVEQPIECDALLPDYCPDIVRILKCTTIVVITSRKLMASRLEMEGMACITVLYASGRGSMARVEYKVPFSKAVDLKGDAEGATLTVKARPDYVNCRAVNQRRLDIRGAVVLSVKVTQTREELVIADGEGAGLQLRQEPCEGTRTLGQSTKDSRVTETLELAYGKPPIETILRYCGSPRALETKVVGGKAVVRGELSVRIFYCSTQNTYEQMEYTIPTSVVVELDGLDEDCLCDVTQELLSLSLEPGADGAGELRNIALDGMLQVTVTGYRSYQGQTCSDCYSTRYPCTFRTRQLPVQRVDRLAREQFSQKETVSMPENVESVLDLWCDVAGVNARPDPTGGLMVEARLSVTMLARMGDGEIYCFDKLLELRHPVAAGGMSLEPRLLVLGCAFAFTGGDSMEVRCDFLLEGAMYTQDRVSLIEDVAVDERHPKTDLAAPGLYIYMADQSETTWDIAKRYNTDPQRIGEENPEQEEAGRRILLIPV